MSSSRDEAYTQGDYDISAKIDCKKPIHCCKFHPKGDVFAVGLSDSSINIYRKSDFQLLYTLIDNDTKNTRLPVTSIKFYNKSDDPNADHYKILIASYVCGYIKYWHYPSKSCIYTISDKITEPLHIDFNSNYDKFAVCGYNESINVYDNVTKKLIRTLESSHSHSVVDGHTSRVFCVKYNPSEPNQLFSGGWDNSLQIWDDRIAHSQKYLSGPHICGDAIDIDTKYNHLLTGSWRKCSTLQIWDLRKQDLIRDAFQKNSNSMIYACQWLSDDSIFIGGSEKNCAMIYDRGTLNLIGGLMGLENAVVAIDNDRSSKSLSMIIASERYIYFLKKRTPNRKLN